MIKNNKLHISNLRREYRQGALRRSDLSANPLDLFAVWLQQARERGLTDPTAMSIATVDENRQPYQRIVLLKYFDEKGLVFYTSLASRKGKQLTKNPQISLLFPWHTIERQVIFLGKVERIITPEVLKYFQSRPKYSQISTWVAQQSSHVASRLTLESKFLELMHRFQKIAVPIPMSWGGFRVKVDSVEFWQGRTRRLHDRFLYQRNKDNWKINRLAP